MSVEDNSHSDGRQRTSQSPEELERELASRVGQFETLLATTADGFWLADLRGRLLDVNDTYCQMSGYRREQLLTMSIPDLDSDDDAEAMRRRIEHIVQVGTVRFESHHRRRDGRVYPVEVSTTYWPDGEAFLAFIRDISIRREADAMRARLQEVQKMEALGTMAAGIAHDFNNLLTAVLGQAQQLRRELEEGTRGRRSVEAIETAALQATELARQLLGFGRRTAEEKGVVDVRGIVDDLAQLLRQTIDRRIAVVVETEARPPVVEGHAARIQQLLLNLTLNARDALPDGGEIRITLARRDEPQRGPGLAVTVADDGVGIAPELRERIFEPFYTTGRERGRSGMGLAIAWGIAAEHGGWIACDSEPGQGSRFTIWLPATDAEEQAPTAVGIPPAPVSGSGRVLVIDDDEIVRDVAGLMLESLGYEVVFAVDGRDGVERFLAEREASRPVDLVLLDVTMPVMNGAVCLAELKKIDPDVRVLAASGNDPGEVTGMMLDAGAVGLVEKPFIYETFSVRIADAMAG